MFAFLVVRCALCVAGCLLFGGWCCSVVGLFVTCCHLCLILGLRFLLFVLFCWMRALVAVRCALSLVCSLLCEATWSLLVVGCVLYVVVRSRPLLVHCVSFVVGCWLFVVRCLVSVVVCVFVVCCRMCVDDRCVLVAARCVLCALCVVVLFVVSRALFVCCCW